MLPENYVESEAPKADIIQGILTLAFFTIWAADSFWLQWTIEYSKYVPDLIRNGLFLILMAIGAYVTWKAHQQIFGTERDEAELIDYGVYRYSRHPMYLGIMTMYLGLVLSSFSIAAFAALIIIFFFYDYLASYEEDKLIEFFGDRYLQYRKRVHKWL